MYLEGNLAQYAFVNNIVFSATAYPALVCGTSYNYLSATPVVIDHNDIVNTAGPGYGGACPDQTGTFGNIAVDPTFSSPATGDFRLRQGSPAIDTGNTSILANLADNNVTFDAGRDGSPRVLDATGLGSPVIDMGAYEFTGQADQPPVTLELLPSSFDVPGGDTINLTVSLVSAAGKASGVIQFSEDGHAIGSAVLDSTDHATLPTAALTPGVHSFVATFDGAAGFPPSVSVRIYVLVEKYIVDLQLASSANPSLVGQTVTFMVTETAADRTFPGPIILRNFLTNAVLATLTPDRTTGTATFNFSSFPMGTNILAANYFGDATHATAVTTLLQVVSTGYQNSTTISSLANPAAVGQTVTFVASVVSNSQNSGAPTGQFVFSEGNTTLATVPFTSGGPAVSGADFSIATLPAGTHIITVTYQPTGNFNGSSASVVEVIRGKASSISFMASPQSTLALAPVTLSAVVSASSVTPTGTVTFHDGGATLGSASVAANGSSSLTVSFAAGSHLLTASYSGDSTFGPTTSVVVTEIVTLNPTLTSLVASPTPNVSAFQAITLTAKTQAPGFSSASLCGPSCVPPTVRFFANGNVVASVPVQLDGSAAASVILPAGSYQLLADFATTPYFAESASPSITEQVLPAAITLNLAASPSPAYQNQPVTLTANLGGAPPSALSGSITFLDDGVTLGTVAAGTASVLTTRFANTGVHSLSAVFSGGSNLSPASGSATLNILPQDFAISLQSASLSIATKHHATIAVTLTTIGSLTDTIHLSCGNLPVFATCTFSKSDLVTDGTNQPAELTLTVDTDFLLSYAAASPENFGAKMGLRPGIGALAMLLPFLFLTRRPIRSLSGRLLLLASCLLPLASCGGREPGSTSPGTYTLQVTGQAAGSGVIHTTPLTLTVTP